MISFYTADIRYSLRSRVKLRAWLSGVAAKEGYALRDLNIILCSDEYLYRLNVDFLKHRTYTDIITFDYSESKREISGELYISLDRIRYNANKLKINVKDELHRVMVHGLLHLCGYSDKTPRKKIQMTAKENFYLTRRTF